MRSIALLFVVSCLAGCSSTMGGLSEIGSAMFNTDPDKQLPAEDEFTRSEPLAEDLDVLWQRAKIALPNAGYMVGERGTNFEERQMISRWRTMLAPAAREGRRRRAVVRFEPAGPGRWVVAVAMQQQMNSEIEEPLNPAAADWERDGVDASRGSVLLYQLSSFAEANPYD